MDGLDPLCHVRGSRTMGELLVKDAARIMTRVALVTLYSARGKIVLEYYYTILMDLDLYQEPAARKL